MTVRRVQHTALFAGQLGRCDDQSCAGVIDDLLRLTPMQLGVDRHRNGLRSPDAEQQLDMLRAVLADDHDAFADQAARTQPGTAISCIASTKAFRLRTATSPITVWHFCTATPARSPAGTATRPTAVMACANVCRS